MLGLDKRWVLRANGPIYEERQWEAVGWHGNMSRLAPFSRQKVPQRYACLLYTSNWIAGANPTAPDYCEPTHILMAAVVLAIILVIYRVCRGFLRQISVLLGLVIGTLIADVLGMADFHAVGEAAALGITTPFAFGYPVFEPRCV